MSRRFAVALAATVTAVTVAIVAVSCAVAHHTPFRFAQRGINVYVSTDKFKENAPQAVTDRANKVFDYVVDLGANSVSLFIPIFTDGAQGSTVSRQVKTPSDSLLRLVVASARVHHLRVMFRPALDQNNLSSTDNWRGDIQPADRNQWFATYTSTLRPLWLLAQELQVETFQVGVELDSLEGDPHWTDVVKAAKSDYRGEVSYSVHWSVFAKRTNKAPTGSYGITAYPPLNLADDAPPDQVLAAWNGWLDAVGNGRDMSKIGFDEVGIPSAAGMYRRPYSWDGQDMVYDPRIQATWFTAACLAAKQHKLPWVYFWKIDFFRDPDAADPVNDPPTSFLRRPGEGAIRACFTEE